jgi:chemotaxis methyl-accepting protein methylase
MDLAHVRFSGTPKLRRRLEGRSRTADPANVGRVGNGLPAAAFRSWPAQILAEAGLSSDAYRPRALERRTAACLRALRTRTEDEANRALRINPALLATALDALLIGVSEFRRDADTFAAIETAVVPALSAAARPLRILSIGCSTGEELYSIAMLLAEARLLERAELLGIDCRTTAVAAAAAGVFVATTLERVPQALRDRYFERCATGWQVTAVLRNTTRWATLDALRALPAGPWDLVLCRNVLIYLDRAAAHDVLTRAVNMLAPGGFLVLGKAERPQAELGLTQVGRSVYRKHAG